MRGQILLCCMLFPSMILTRLEANDNVAVEARKAQEFLEAKDYDEALSAYETAAEHADEEWQRQALQYGAGNVRLLSGKYGEALQTYHESSQQGLFPELAARVAFNRAVAEIKRAQTVSEPKEADDNALDAVHLGLWREAVESAREAESALCVRDKALGAQECPSLADVASLKQAAQEGLASAIDRIDTRRASEQSPDVGVPSLQIGIAGLTDLLQIMSASGLDPQTVKNYQEYFAATSQEWIPTWENLRRKFPSVSPEFSQAERAFTDASGQVSQGDFSGARRLLDLSSQQLETVMASLYSGRSVSELLQVLLTGYTQALARGTVDKNVLQVALRQMKELEKKVDATSPVADSYQVLYGLNKDALEMVRDRNEDGALMALQGAEISVRMMLAKLDTRPSTPKSVLQQLIQDQQGLLGINRTFQSRAGSEKIATMLEKLQGDLLSEARKFPEAMKTEENEQWKKGTFQQLAANWDDISSMFGEGYAAAQSAHDLLGGSQDPTEQTISFQMQAFDDWMKALALLENMKVREQDLAAHPQPKSTAPSTAKLMQQLEGMEQDDKSLSAAVQGATPEKVEKPW